MSILQARAYDLRKSTPVALAQHGARILVTRRWLRGIGRNDIDYWLPDAAPSSQLLGEYRTGYISGEVFLARYEREQFKQQSCRVVRYEDGRRVADRVEAISPLTCLKHLEEKHGIATVICWEREPDLCHRHHLVQLLNGLS